MDARHSGRESWNASEALDEALALLHDADDRFFAPTIVGTVAAPPASPPPLTPAPEISADQNSDAISEALRFAAELDAFIHTLRPSSLTPPGRHTAPIPLAPTPTAEAVKPEQPTQDDEWIYAADDADDDSPESLVPASLQLSTADEELSEEHVMTWEDRVAHLPTPPSTPETMAPRISGRRETFIPLPDAAPQQHPVRARVARAFRAFAPRSAHGNA